MEIVSTRLRHAVRRTLQATGTYAIGVEARRTEIVLDRNDFSTKHFNMVRRIKSCTSLSMAQPYRIAVRSWRSATATVATYRCNSTARFATTPNIA